MEIVPSEEKIGKIADNYKWYYVFSVSPDDSELFKVGRNITVNFDGIKEPLKLEIYEKIERMKKND